MSNRSTSRALGARIRGIPLRLRLDRTLPIPVHTQVYDELRRCMRSGALPPGAQLPSVQWLCQTYALSTTTVSRVLRDLKQEGAISTVRGAGCTVKAVSPPVTEVVVLNGGAAPLTPQSFYYDLIVGLKRGFAEPARDCVLTHYDARLPVAEELTALMRLRHADGLVVYRPGPSLTAGLRGVARRHPIVSLLMEPASAPVDCVLSDPRTPLRAWLHERLAAGKRSFAFLGKTSLLDDDASPYRGLLEAFRDVLNTVGVRPLEALVNDNPGRPALRPGEADRLVAEQGWCLPAGTVVVAETPHIAAAVYRSDRPLDLIAYTESPFSVAEFGGRMALLFLGLDRVGEAAAALLRAAVERRGAARNSGKAPQRVALAPVVIPPGCGIVRDRAEVTGTRKAGSE